MPRPDIKDIDLEAYFDESAAPGSFEEARAFPTVSPGVYRLQVTRSEGKAVAERPTAVLYITVTDEMGQRKLASTRTDISWVPQRNAEGKLDQMYKRYEQLVRALYPERSDAERERMKLREILDDTVKFPLKGYVTEKFRVPQPDGGIRWLSAKTPDEAKEFRQAGYRVINGVANFTAFSG